MNRYAFLDLPVTAMDFMTAFRLPESGLATAEQAEKFFSTAVTDTDIVLRLLKFTMGRLRKFGVLCDSENIVHNGKLRGILIRRERDPKGKLPTVIWDARSHKFFIEKPSVFVTRTSSDFETEAPTVETLAASLRRVAAFLTHQ